MEGVVVLSRQLECISRLLTTLRDERTDRALFSQHSQRLMSLICEEGLSHLDACIEKVTIRTPTNSFVDGISLNNTHIVAVSVIRAGDSMLESFLSICATAQVGKVLIQRDETTALPNLLYYKIPKLEGKQIVLLDPMLATGGSAKEAIKLLISNGAKEHLIAFFSVISSEDGIRTVLASYPEVKIVTGHIDEGLNEKAYIVPGLGDFGDRYFGTVQEYN